MDAMETLEPAGPEPQHDEHGGAAVAPRRRWGIAVALLGVLALSTAGVSLAVHGIVQEHRSAQTAEPGLSSDDRDALGVDTGRFLWDEPAAVAVSRALTDAPGVSVERLYELDLYSNYAFATGEDPADDRVAVHSEWRRGAVTVARVRLGGSRRDDSLGSLPTFALADVPWSRLAALMDEAVRRLEVPDPDVRYLQIDAGLYGRPGLTLRVYVSGPSAPGGLVEADATGTIVRVIPDGVRPSSVQ